MIDTDVEATEMGGAPDTRPAPTDKWSASKLTYALPNGATLACITRGDPKQPALLLIHGFTDSSRTWVGLEEAFPKHRLVIPDLRGHGQSFVPDYGYSLTHFVNDLRLLLAELGIIECAVIGHSLGGMIAQLLAATVPELVSKLILIGTTASPNDGSVSKLHATINGLTAPIDPEGPFMQQWYENPGNVDETYMAQLRAESARIPIHVFHGIIQATSTTDLLQIIGDISAETLILWGDADPFFGHRQQQAMRKAITGSRLIPMKGLGHNPNWEEPAKTADLIREFLSS